MSEERTITGNYEIALNLTNSRQIKITGYLYSDDVAEDVNGRLDIAQDALDRQFVRCDIITKEAQRKVHLQNIDNIRKKFNEVLDKQKSGLKLNSTDKQIIEQGDVSIKAATDYLKQLDEEILIAKRKVGMAE